MTNIHDCWTFTTELKRQGVPVPKTLSDVIDTYEAMEAKVDAGTATLSLEADLSLGKAKPADIGARFADVVQERIYRTHAADALADLTPTLVDRFVEAIRGKAGEQIITSLRPRFDDAVAGIHRAAGLFRPDSEPAHILALGAEAVTAYNELPAHRTKLDAIMSGIVQPLATTFHVTGQRNLDRPSHGLVAWLVNPENPGAVAEAAQAFGRVGHGNPGGRWHWIITAADVRLNTPAEAATVLDHLAASADAERKRILEAMDGGELPTSDGVRFA